MLGFDDGKRNGFCVWLQRTAQNVIGPSLRASARLVAYDVNGRRNFFNANIAAPPAARFQRWIDQLKADLSLVAAHLREHDREFNISQGRKITCQN